MRKLLLLLLLCAICSGLLKAQKTWVNKGISVTKLDTLGDGFESLRGSFTIENTSIYEVMNLILDVDGYDWVEGGSVSKMLLVDEADSSFTFDFFINIPWLFVKRTGRVKVDVHFKDDTFYTKSYQLRNYERNEEYDLVDFYSAQWKLQKLGTNDVKVTYLGVYQDQKMLININGIIINQIRKRLSGTFYNLKVKTAETVNPIDHLSWPIMGVSADIKTDKKN